MSYWQCQLTDCGAINRSQTDNGDIVKTCAGCGQVHPRRVFTFGNIDSTDVVSPQGLKLVTNEHSSELESIKSVHSFASTVVVVLGETGVGKSTIVNYLCGVLFKFEDNKLNVALNEDKMVCPVGNTASSKTTVPTTVNICFEERNICVIDTAGTADTRSRNHAIVAASAFSELIARIPHDITAICFTIMYSTLMTNRMSELDSMSRMYRSFLTDGAFVNSNNDTISLPNVRVIYFITRTNMSTDEFRQKMVDEANDLVKNGRRNGMNEETIRNRLTVLNDMVMHAHTIDPTTSRDRDIILRHIISRPTSGAAPKGYINKKWLKPPYDFSARKQVKNVWKAVAANYELASQAITTTLPLIQQHEQNLRAKSNNRQSSDRDVQHVYSTRKQLAELKAKIERANIELFETMAKLKDSTSRIRNDMKVLRDQQEIEQKFNTNEEVDRKSETFVKKDHMWTSYKTYRVDSVWFDVYHIDTTSCDYSVISSNASRGVMTLKMKPFDTNIRASVTVNMFRYLKNTDRGKTAIADANREIARLQAQINAEKASTAQLERKQRVLEQAIEQDERTKLELERVVATLPRVKAVHATAVREERLEATKGRKLRRAASSSCELVLSDSNNIYDLSAWFLRDPEIHNQLDTLEQSATTFIQTHNAVKSLLRSVSVQDLDTFRGRYAEFHRQYHVLSGRHLHRDGSVKVKFLFAMTNGNHKAMTHTLQKAAPFEATMRKCLSGFLGIGEDQIINLDLYAFKWAYRSVHYSSSPNELGMPDDVQIVIAPRLV